MTITLRGTKGSPLTHDELDANFTSFEASSGSSLVGFIQSGNGTLIPVARTAQAKMREVVTTEDFSGTPPTGLVGLGQSVLAATTTGAYSTALGYNALMANTSGYGNTAIGAFAMVANTTGGSAVNGGNTAVGANAMQANTSGDNNTGVGLDALYTNQAGYSNTAVGSNALGFGQDGHENVAVGWRALFNGAANVGSTAVGVKALNANLTGTGNVALGYFAGSYELGSNAFYVDNQDRTNTAGDKAGALLYGVFNATASSQTLAINAAVTVPYSVTVGRTAADANVIILVKGTAKAVRLGTNATNSFIEGVDPTGTASYQALAIGGLTLDFTASGVSKGQITSTGLNSCAIGATTASTLRGTSVEVTTGGSTTISTGVGSVKMSTGNAATNASWIPVIYAGTTYYVPGWTNNAP